MYSSLKMQVIVNDFRFSGYTTLISNKLGEYIVYEKIMKKGFLLPLSSGLFKFHFKQGSKLPYKKMISGNDFVIDYAATAKSGYIRLSTFTQEFDIDSIVTNKYVKECLINAPLSKYQFLY